MKGDLHGLCFELISMIQGCGLRNNGHIPLIFFCLKMHRALLDLQQSLRRNGFRFMALENKQSCKDKAIMILVRRRLVSVNAFHSPDKADIIIYLLSRGQVQAFREQAPWASTQPTVATIADNRYNCWTGELVNGCSCQYLRELSVCTCPVSFKTG